MSDARCKENSDFSDLFIHLIPSSSPSPLPHRSAAAVMVKLEDEEEDGKGEKEVVVAYVEWRLLR